MNCDVAYEELAAYVSGESGDDRVILSLVWQQYANRGLSEYEVSANTGPELQKWSVR